MAFDDTQPTDSTKLRSLGTVIRPNWVAIEEADTSFQPQALNLADRTVAGVPNDPTAISDAFIIYSKTDSVGNAEFFGINDNSDILQFTRGAPTLAANNGSIFIPGGVTLKWGNSTFSGTSLTAAVTFPSPFLSSAYVAHPSYSASPPNATPLGYTSLTTTGFTVTRSTGNTGVNNFSWIAIGV